MTNEEIIDAAFRVWGRNFYRKTSLSELAGELRVSKPALYKHFENKQALTAAMTERFLDDFAASIRADFEKARRSEDPDEGVFTIISSISDFFARNVHALIFSLMNIYYRKLDGQAITDRLRTRGVDLAILSQIIKKKYTAEPVVIQLIFATLIFLMSHFHSTLKTLQNTPSEKQIQEIILKIKKITLYGIGCKAEKIGQIDYKKLEKQIGTPNSKTEPLFKAVAEAVAEAGPWDASMDMVAKRLGISKSSLYGHFKNRKDMLRRLFITEFHRIIEFARNGIKLSDIAEWQLYLGIFSIAVYFRSQHEILVALDWIRTRKLELGRPRKEIEIFRLFEDIDIETMKDGAEEEKILTSHLILFLLINILMENLSKKGTDNNDIRILYRYITLGLGGFIK